MERKTPEVELLPACESSYQFDISRIVEHAVGNTISTVVTTFEALLRFGNLPVNLFDMVFHAELSARELPGKISALAELFGKEDSASKLRIASYDIEQFFTALIEQMNQSLSDKIRGGISFSLTSDSVRGVSFDARRISMILYHLITNALQHGRTENKKIKVICKAERARFELSVRDYGGGVPEGIRPKLFTKFEDEFSLENQMIGLLPPRLQGLGLPLCRKLTQDMGGELQFKNYSTGAKFTIILPQEQSRIRENTIFYPDDELMMSCMAPLFLKLEKGMKNNDNNI